MKELWNKYKKLIIGVLSFILLGIPLILHLLFKVKAVTPFFSAEWSAGDVLNYYGVIIGAILAVAGVFFTIQYSQANYRQDVIYRCLPFMTVTRLLVESKAPSILGTECSNGYQVKKDTREIGEEYRIERLYYFIDDKMTTIKEKLSDEQMSLIAHNGLKDEVFGNGLKALTSVNLLYTPLEIRNVGVGAAALFSVGLNHEDVPKEKRIYSIATSLSVGEKYQISIYCENWKTDNVGDYDLCLLYYDVLGNKYEQNYIYSVFRDDSGRFSCRLRMNGTQNRVKGSE